jgi:purple acid phosphatase-like protein/calcineurin-like phosphoesterase family protein
VIRRANETVVSSANGGPVRRQSIVLLGVLALVATGVSPMVAQAASIYDLLVSASANRTSAAPLQGRSVGGAIYVFVSPATGVTQVRFYLDDSQRTGTPIKIEGVAPWDFAGTAANGSANPFSTTALADGQHTITVAVDKSGGGTDIVTATFAVSNGAPPPSTFSLQTSSSPDRASPSALDGKTVGGSIYVFVSPATGATQVRFYLDDPQRTGSPIKTEGAAPWDFAGTATNGTANPYATTTLANGPHAITAGVDKSGGGTDVLTATFTVANGGPPPPEADQIHLAWTGSSATTLTVVWRTLDTTVPSVVQYRKTGDTSWQSATGALRTSGTPGTLHEVTLGSLTPSTAYEYQVQSSATDWSPIASARTAPAPGPADFDFVYVADTGLIGRTDGLATGTQQVRDEIAKVNPLLVLGGGDYAYFDTDKRYGTLEKTIDAWFNQMQPIVSRSMFMPTYGNHEVVLGEGFSNWSARFPTPAGWNGRRNYSFDVGNVHFTSILAVADTGPLEQASVDWIEGDLAAAEAAGQRWLIPFMHVPGFGDGTNHPANATVRGQLAPIFERHGVKLVIASSDQAYERSYPLKSVTSSTWTRTSTATDCYTTTDGVTWVKVSPGGKLSNISGNFSPFGTSPPPSWTAYRDNTSHVFARVRVGAAGTLAFEAWGVKGDGSPAFLKDSFRYTTGTCSTVPALSFTPDTLSFTAQQGGTAGSKTATLAASDGSAASFTLSESSSWLSVSPGSGQTPGTITLTADPAGLAPGSYTASVTAAASGYTSGTLAVTLTVTGAGTTYTLLVSKSANRSSAVPLAAATASGNIYVFTSPDTSGIARVRFFLDNPQMIGTPRRTESSAPYDFAGGTTTNASPFDTKTIANGSQTITAAIDFTAGGTNVVSATFTVAN